MDILYNFISFFLEINFTVTFQKFFPKFPSEKSLKESRTNCLESSTSVCPSKLGNSKRFKAFDGLFQ